LANISIRCVLLMVLFRMCHDLKVEKYSFFYFFVVAHWGKCTGAHAGTLLCNTTAQP
jgi:hypothetical protein